MIGLLIFSYFVKAFDFTILPNSLWFSKKIIPYFLTYLYLMRLIERLQDYLIYSQVSAYAFEHSCALSNGYLAKQLKGKGSVGSDILERIKDNYSDLSLIWLVTGKGRMLLSFPNEDNNQVHYELNEEEQIYFTSKDEVIKLLNKQIKKLEQTIADKDKINALLELQLQQSTGPHNKRSR